jgi:membrane-associated protein
LVAAAIAAAEGRLSLAFVIGVAFVGGVVGCQLGYWLGSRYGRELLVRPGTFLTFRVRILEKGEVLLGKYGALASFLVPSLICGIKRVPRRTFVVFSTLSRIWWALSTGVVAFYVGENLTEIIRHATHAPVLVVIAVIAVAVVIARWVWVERTNAKPAAQVPPGSA